MIREYARVGVLTDDEALMRRAVDGLLFLFTIDPLGCESFDGRAGGPCQERCMYSDGRININAAIAYDLLAGVFTQDNGLFLGHDAHRAHEDQGQSRWRSGDDDQVSHVRP